MPEAASIPYHARWRAARDETKYNRLIEFGRTLPRIRRPCSAIWRSPAATERILATRPPLERTLTAREHGKTRDTRSSGSRRSREACARPGTAAALVFRGKGGKCHTSTSPTAARIVLRCQDCRGRAISTSMISPPADDRSADVNPPSRRRTSGRGRGQCWRPARSGSWRKRASSQASGRLPTRSQWLPDASGTRRRSAGSATFTRRFRPRFSSRPSVRS